jgi:hypothetical protein
MMNPIADFFFKQSGVVIEAASVLVELYRN